MNTKDSQLNKLINFGFDYSRVTTVTKYIKESTKSKLNIKNIIERFNHNYKEYFKWIRKYYV